MSYTPLNAIISAVSLNMTSTQTSLVNNSGSAIAALTPVRVNATGNMELIDVSDESSALTVVGITTQSVSNNVSGTIVTQGRIADISTAFAVGDYVYVSKTGDLTNILPEAGSNGFIVGDYIIRIGVVAKNEADSNKKDMFIGMSIIGQL